MKSYFVAAGEEAAGWCFGIVKPYNDVVSALNQILLLSVIINIVTAIIVSTVMLVLIKRLMQPMEDMKAFIRENFVAGEKEIPEGLKDCKKEHLPLHHPPGHKANVLSIFTKIASIF